MKAIWNGEIIAESDDTLVIEGNHYFPVDTINQNYFTPSDTQTVCPWKGTASYYHVEVGGKQNKDAAWYYPDPKPMAKGVKDRIAFWRGVTVEK